MISFIVDKYKYEQHITEIDLYVQEIGGSFVLSRNTIEFRVPQEYQTFMLLKYPFLQEVAYYQ